MTKKLLLAGLVVVAAAFAAEGFKVIGKIKIGGTGGWDYLAVDPDADRVYASHGALVEVVDPKAGKVVGQIAQLHGVHGIALAPEFGKGFISNGQSNSVTVFDLKTLAKIGEPATGTNPDAICYEPKTQRVFTFNGRSNDSTAINAKTGEPLATFPVKIVISCSIAICLSRSLTRIATSPVNTFFRYFGTQTRCTFKSVLV